MNKIRRRHTYHNSGVEKRFNHLMKSITKLNITKRGFPDFMVVDKNDNFVAFVECKTERGKLRYEQDIFRKFCERYNIPFYIWRPNDELPF